MVLRNFPHSANVSSKFSPAKRSALQNSSVLTGKRARSLMRAIRGRSDPASALATGDLAGEDSRPSAVVDWALYTDGLRRRDIGSYNEAIRRARKGEGFVWIGLFEPSSEELEDIGAEFGLHPLSIEDAVTAHQRPKLERYDDSMFAVFKTVRYCRGTKAGDHRIPFDEADVSNEVVETGEVMVFVGEAFVVTVRHGDHGALGQVRSSLEDNPEHLSLGPSTVLHAVADLVVDDYLIAVDQVQDDLDELEIAVFSTRGARNVERVYHLKREVLELKRAVAPLAAPLRTLSERHMRLIASDIREYFRDVDDHLSRVRETVAGYDELLTSILQACLAQLTVAENEDMRKISAWVAILAVPTMLGGIYGMNFDSLPPKEEWWGFPAAILVMVVVCFALHRYFKRNGWL